MTSCSEITTSNKAARLHDGPNAEAIHQIDVVARPFDVMLQHRPSPQTPQLMAEQVLLILLWTEFRDIRLAQAGDDSAQHLAEIGRARLGEAGTINKSS